MLHPVENNVSYISQEIPVFKDKTDYKFYPLIMSEKRATTIQEFDSISVNKEKYEKFLKVVENSLLNDKLYHYEAKAESGKTLNDIQKEKYTTFEKVSLGCDIKNEINYLNHERKISPLEYIESLKEKNLESLPANELKQVENEFLLEKKEMKVEALNEKINNLNNLKLEIVKANNPDEMLSKYVAIKKEIATAEKEKEEAISDLNEFKEKLEDEKDSEINEKDEDNDKDKYDSYEDDDKIE